MTKRPEESWQTRSRRDVYSGRVRLAEHSVVLADGVETTYEVDESIPFAVATLVIDVDAVVLTRQYRYPIDRWIYDLPGGAGAIGEEPEDAALRELEEELGLVGRELLPLHTFFVNPGRSAWPVHVFVCLNATGEGVADDSDPAEQVRSVRLSVDALDTLIARGEIVDPALIVARSLAAVHGYLPRLGSGATSRS